MNPDLRDAALLGGVTYVALLALYVLLVGASSALAGELTRSQWPRATYLLAGACVLLIAGWAAVDGRSIAGAVAVGVAPVLVVLTALAAGTLIDLVGEPIHPGILAFFLAGTFVLGQIVAFVGYGVGTLVAFST